MENKTIIAIIGLLLILSVFLGIKACSTESPKFHYKVEKDETDLLLETALKKKEKQYAHNIWILEKRNDSLSKIIDASKIQINKSREKASILEKKVRDLSKHYLQSTDTSEKLMTCDSLRIKAEELIVEQEHKDSLYQETLCDLDSVIKNQDTALSVCQNHNEQLSELLNMRVEEKKQLQQEITALQKENARKTIVQKILTTTTLVLSGIAAALLIH